MRKEILKTLNKEVAIEAAGNMITSIRDKNISKRGARVFDKGRIYSSSFVGNISDDDLVKIALENQDSSIEYDYGLPEVASELNEEILLRDKTEQDFYDDYEKALSGLTQEFPDFIFSGKATLSQVTKELSVDGKNLKVTYDEAEWYFLYKHKKSASMMDGYFGDAQVGKFDIANGCKSYYQYLNVYEKMTSLEAGMMPVVFTSPTSLLGKTLESLKIDNYKKNIGVFKGKLGEKILSENFSLSDISYDPSIGALNAFDSDGLVRENPNFPLIANGVFKNLISDSRNAKKYSVKSTGNSQRSFDSNAILGFNTPIIAKGKRSNKEVLKELPKCLVVEMAAGGDFTDNGDYSTPVQAGYLLENGVVKGRLPQITLTTSIQKMFGDDLLEISNTPFSNLDKNPGVFMNMNVLIN